MNRNRNTLFFIFLFVLIAIGWLSLAPAYAVKWAERPLLSWEKKALKAFDRNDFNKAMDIAKDEEDDPNGNAPVIIYFCHAQKYYLERNRNSALYYKQQYKIMENRVRGENLALLTRIVALPSIAWNKKINKRFIDKAFENAGEEYLGAILYYLRSHDPDVAKGAIKGLQVILQRKRNIVNNGGTIGAKDRKWMSDKRLLKLLVRMTGEGTSPIAGFMSKVPAFVRKKAMGGAPACLALIEDPALPLLKDAATMGNANAAATIQLIQDARGARLAKSPNSTWYSATGR